MKTELKIGIIGDFDKSKISHPATNEAIRHAADYLSVNVAVTWLPTPSFLAEEECKKFEEYDAIWASSGSPYRSMEGAIKGIQAARRTGRPFIAT